MKPPTAKAQGNGETILIIDDEAGVRDVLAVLLQLRGYRTLIAADGPAGLELYRTHRETVRAVLTDMRMPVMHGAEVISKIRAINPDARIVGMSGYLAGSAAPQTEPGRLTYVRKPMSADEVVQALKSVLN